MKYETKGISLKPHFMIEVLSAGLYTTVQDTGRFGFRSKGVPVSGAMDGDSAALANSLVGNPKVASLLEFTMLGPTLLFSEKTTIAITGAFFRSSINEKPLQLNNIVQIEKGTVLKLGSASQGMYGYLAIQGGFVSETVLGSQSFYNGITNKAKLEKGDLLNFDSNFIPSDKKNHNLIPLNLDQNSIEVLAGPEFNNLTKKEKEIVLKKEYKISPQSNRMAIVFEEGGGVAVNEILTAPVQPGTVQITPSGNLIILMRDAQTTGGYGRIFQLPEATLNFLAQQRPGNTISFSLIG